MRPVREGDRGAAVEDIQRRLLVLEYDIGPTGVDGVFLGATLAAVRDFQTGAELEEDGLVGPETWAALVDATFTLGDRLLYLRYPYLHGRDVRDLQRVLNTLGFSCGDADGIFGAFTERAVREFQQNVGQGSDGIVGAETISALTNLRHVWEGKEAATAATWKLAPARAAEVLSRVTVVLAWDGEEARLVADRIENLALASQPDAKVGSSPASGAPSSADLTLRLVGESPTTHGTPVVSVTGEATEGLTARLVTALGAEHAPSDEVIVEVGELVVDDEQRLQAVAVGLLDGICAGLA